MTIRNNSEYVISSKPFQRPSLQATMGSPYYFVIIGSKDNPVYEADLAPTSRPSSAADGIKFIIHSALDIVEEIQWNTNATYLKVVDKFNEFLISAFVSAGNTKFMLLHDTKSEDSIKNFFQDVHELYLKVLMNPFYEFNQPITNSYFDGKVRLIAKRFL
ncbi:trafficking protein particle complex subunit 2-like protein [Endogone sp. FLAS-F59071]|nr:trafficking protein particle complex subunit 2-like protein [Endogone sp. FLAS-F59071]|eukprot:RUS20951.1 trafficking protein particle complex subunit 2-like protein [Endogone sp. FLAS-F59071]